MKVIFGVGNFKTVLKKNKIVTVGVFDGLHRGHQTILRRVVREAKAKRATSVVVTFDFHPSRLLQGRKEILALTTLQDKLALLKKEGIDLCFVVSFNRAFARIPAEKFVKDILLDKIGMLSLYVGEDFVFGRGKRGDVSLLKRFSRKYHFGLRIVRHLKINNRIVSSTRIRSLVSAGLIDEANHLLGRPIFFSGDVVKGDGRGKSLGFPTANIRLSKEILVPHGIYATEVLLEGKRIKGLTYIGAKATFFRQQNHRSIEVYLLDFKKNIYGKRIEVRLLKKIRPDRRFVSPETLVRQIKRDLVQARKIFKKSHRYPA